MTKNLVMAISVFMLIFFAYSCKKSEPSVPEPPANTATITSTHTMASTFSMTPTVTATATQSITPTHTSTVNREMQADAGTLGLWHFNEPSGQTLADSSGGGRNIILGADTAAGTDDPSITLSGRAGFGNCLYLDKAQSQYAWSNNTFPFASNSFSVELWMKSADLLALGILCKGNGIDFNIYKDIDNTFAASVGDGGNWTSRYVVGSNIADGSWHYLALTYNYGTSTMAMYLDGSPVMTDTPLSVAVPSPGYISIGGYVTGNYTGYIDEVRISNFTRTPAEILAYWNQATQ